MKKKTLSLFINFVLVVALMLSCTIVASASTHIALVLNGENIVPEVSPQNISGRILVPFRFIGEKLGANVKWQQSTKTITMTKGDNTVILQINNPVINLNGVNKTLDCKPIIVKGTTLVPVRAIAEALNANVEWRPNVWQGVGEVVIIEEGKSFLELPTKEINIEVGETYPLTITNNFGDNVKVSYGRDLSKGLMDNDFNNYVNCTWGEWQGNNITLSIMGKKAGNAKIDIYVGEGHGSQIINVNVNATLRKGDIDSLEEYLNSIYASVETPMGTMKMSHSIDKNTDSLFPYDYEINTDWSGASPFAIKYSIEYTDSQKEKTIELSHWIG